MKLIEKLGLREIISKSGKMRKRQFGLFECPTCNNKVERFIPNGEKARSCGSSACKNTHPTDGAATKRDPIYTAWIYMKQLCKEQVINYPENWKDFNTFYIEIGKNRSVGSRFTRYDIDKGYSIENCYWKVNSEFVGEISHTAQTNKNGRLFEQHGMYGTRQYRIWQNMKNRCYFDKHKSYKDYGAKGITVCPQWKDSFYTFWMDMQENYTEEMTIDRIDSNKGYYKDNCRWITLADNSARARAIVTLQLDKETGETIKEWPSSRNAGIELKIDPSSIGKVIRGKKKSAGGYGWAYK